MSPFSTSFLSLPASLSTLFQKRKCLFFALLLAAPHLASALDYYWVGGSGNWSEYATHWATTAAGGTFHLNVPTAGDDVFFTANGGVPYTVFVNAASTVPKCKNMDWSAAPNGTVWHGDATGRLDIYGSLLLDAGMSFTFPGEVHFIAFGSASTITSNGIVFQYPCNLYFEGTTGGWMLNDALFAGNYLIHSGGTLMTNDKTVTIGDYFEGTSPGRLELGDSDFINNGGTTRFYYAPADFLAGTSHIICNSTGNVTGAPSQPTKSQFYDVTFTYSNPAGFAWGDVNSTLKFEGFGTLHGYYMLTPPVINNVIFEEGGLIYNAFNYVNLTLTAGKTYTIQDYAGSTGTKQTILSGGSLTANSGVTCTDFITIKSWNFGTSVGFVNNSGSNITVTGVALEYVQASGTNSLINDYGLDLGGSTGWTYTNACPGLNLYWIGGAGDWDDYAHWSTSSGGASCNCLPTPATNVFFDANSGFVNGEVVNVVTAAYCKNMNWSAVTGKPILLGNGGVLNIYGSVVFASPDEMTYDMPGGTYFRAAGAETITSNRQNYASVIFEGNGSWELLDSFKILQAVHTDGTIYSLGNPIVCKNWLGNWANTNGGRADRGAELWLGVGGSSSTVTLLKDEFGQFYASYELGNFHAAESTIVGEGGGFISGDNGRFPDFWNVTFTPGAHAGSFLHANVLNKITFLSAANLVGINSCIHEAEFVGGGFIFDDHTFDILTLYGGEYYKFQPYAGTGNTTQTITSGGAFNQVNSSCSIPTYLYNPTPGATTTFRKLGVGTNFNISHTIFDRVLADQTTGANYNITNCIGLQADVRAAWNITNPSSRDLYWVGGSGDWHDPAHWSLTSGGAGGECPPTPLDDVFFNAASGAGTTTISQPWAFCKDMDWSGSTGILKNAFACEINHVNYVICQSLGVFGSLTFGSGMVNDFNANIWLRASQPATITSNGIHFKQTIIFAEPTGDWSFNDALWTDAYLFHDFGKFSTNNFPLTIGAEWRGNYVSNTLGQGAFLGSSTVRFLGNVSNANNYNYAFAYLYYAPGTFHAGTSHFIFENANQNAIYGNGYNPGLHNVTFKSQASTLWGAKISNKFMVLGNVNIDLANGDNYIHEVEFQGDANLNDSRSYHKMTFAPGKRYTFGGGYNPAGPSTQTIVPSLGVEGQFIAQGLPGQYIEMKSSNPSVPAFINMDDYNGTSTCTKYLFLTGMTHAGTGTLNTVIEDIYVPTPGADVFNNAGWLFFPCNPCPASLPVLDATASATQVCPPGNATLVLSGLKVDEWAIWYSDAAATVEVYNGGSPGANLFQPAITAPITYYARVYSDGGLCVSTVILTVNVTVTTPPGMFSVSGGGLVCVGSPGVPVGLSDSEIGVNYQLQLNSVNSGAPVAGTGNAISFGSFTSAGTYTVVANYPGSACATSMNGSAVVTGSANLAPDVVPGSNAPLPNCTGNLNLTESGGDAVSWVWSGPNSFASTLQNPTIVNPTAAALGTYSVSVTDAAGCLNAASINIPVIFTDNSPPVAVCNAAVLVSLDANGQVTITPEMIDEGSFDNCTGITFSVSPASLNCSHLGIPQTATLTVTDGAGLTDDCTTQVTVEDKIQPNAICHASVNLPLDASGDATLTVSMVNNGSTDNCGIDAFSLSQANFDCDDLGANSVSLIVTDVGGNKDTCFVTVNVQDNLPPTPACQNATVSLDANGSASLAVADVEAGADDNCSVVSHVLTPNTFNCSHVGTPQTVELVIADQGGLTGNCFALVTVQDNLPPTTICKNVTVQLDASGNASVTAAQVDDNSTDNCAIVSRMVSPNTFTCANVGANTVTLTVSDGNLSSTCQATVTVQDNVPPTANCQNISVTLDPSGQATITASQVNNGSSDNCPGIMLSLSQTVFTCSGAGSNVVTLTVTDGGGLSSTCTATVAISDNIAPVALCKNITVQLGANGQVSITASQVDNGSSDNCGSPILSVNPSTFLCANVGANTVTLTASDGNLSNTCQATVTVEDNIPPTANCINISVALSSGQVFIANAALNNGSSDNCAIASFGVSQNLFTCAHVGANLVTLTVTDGAGLSSTCMGTVNVVDNVAPSAQCKNVTVQLDASGNASVTTAQVDNGSVDDCGTPSLSVNPSNFTCANLGANTVTLTATDGGGLTNTCTATVTVQDLLPPAANCQNVTVSVGANGTVTVAASSVNNGSSDNCGIVSMSLSPNTFNCSQVGLQPVILTVFDAANLSATCNAIVEVVDSLPPAANCQNVTVTLDASGQAGITVSQVNDNSSDNCGILSMMVNPANFTCASGGSNSVTLTVTDVNNLVSTCQATVTVQDGIAPTAMCISSGLTISLDASGQASITTGQVDNGSFDNCGGVTLSLNQSNFNCADLGANQVTLTVSDGSLSSTCQTTVTVQDLLPPAANCQNITVALGANGQASITAAQVNNGSSDNCGVSLSVNPSQFFCANVGANSVTLTATDPGGLSATCMATVTVQDNLPPTALCQPLTLVLDGSNQAALLASQVDDGSSDNCGIANLAISTTAFDCNDLGSQMVTLTVTDVNGLTATCQSAILVTENQPPTALCKAAFPLSLDANGMASVTLAQIDDGSFDNCGLVSVVISPTDFDCSDVGNQTVTLTATDVSGLTDACQTIVTVEDNLPPTVTCQDISIELDQSGTVYVNPAQVIASLSDNCSAEVTATISQGQFTCDNVGDNLVTVTVTDPGGNTATCSATVTLQPFLNISSITVTDESCPGVADGSIIIVAEALYPGAHQVMYSITGGVWWNLTGEFYDLDPGTYDVVVRIQKTTFCDTWGDATVGEGTAFPTWYKDVDQDGYSDGVTVTACFASPEFYLPSQLIATSGDCNDYDELEKPGQLWHRDWDFDGYSNGQTVVQCLRPWGYEHSSLLTATSGDCNDNVATIHPGATETCNSTDDDCDGSVDEGLSDLVYVGNVALNNQAEVNAWSFCWSVIEGNLTIQNASVDSLPTLVNLEKVTGNVTIELTMLDSLSWLMSLDSIGGDLKINTNDTLVTLHGLDSLVSVGGDVVVFYNFDLDSCCAIYELVNQVNDHYVGGSISIVSNDTHCDNVAAINDFCDGGGGSFAPPGGGTTEAEEAAAARSFSIFPNPAKDKLILLWQGAALRSGEVQVLDLWGQTVLKLDLAAERMEHDFSLAGLPGGLYFVKVLEEGKPVWMEKIVKQ